MHERWCLGERCRLKSVSVLYFELIVGLKVYSMLDFTKDGTRGKIGFVA